MKPQNLLIDCEKNLKIYQSVAGKNKKISRSYEGGWGKLGILSICHRMKPQNSSISCKEKSQNLSVEHRNIFYFLAVQEGGW